MYIIILSIIALTGYMLYLDLTANHSDDSDAAGSPKEKS